MGRLGFNLVRTKETTSGGAGDCEAGTNFATDDNEEEEEILNKNKRLRQYEPSKKMYLLFFISTTVVTCFCVFVVIPQLIDYFTSTGEVNINDSAFKSQKQSVIDLLDTERSRRYQERLEIMEKFNTLQQNYKQLQREYQKAKEIYLKKLHSAYQSEVSEPKSAAENQSTSSTTEKSSRKSDVVLLSELRSGDRASEQESQTESLLLLNNEVPQSVIVPSVKFGV